MGYLNIDRKLLPIKTHYFLINGGHAGVIPFIAVYAMQLGIAADAMGYIYAILCCITMLSRPFLGSLADRFQRLKLVLVILILVEIVADLGLNFIPSPSESKSNSATNYVLCHQNNTYLLSHDGHLCLREQTKCKTDCLISCLTCNDTAVFCPEDNTTTVVQHLNLSSKCFQYTLTICADARPVTCDVQLLNQYDIGRAFSNKTTNPPLQLCLISIFTALIYICNGSIVSISDAVCFNSLGPKPELYGKQRVWGTLGWGLFALSVGYLNQVLSTSTYNFSAGFYMLVLLFVLDLIVISQLQLNSVKASRNIFRDVGLLFTNIKISFFILQVFCIGIFIGLSRTYLFWYLRTLKASQFLLGCTSAVQCFLGEIPFFFFAGWIVAKMGHVNTFTMSLLAHGLRFLAYSYLENPWWVLPLEVLQGPCFGSFYTAMASYAKLVAPEGTEATVQGLAGGTFEGLGVAMGSLLGGYSFRSIGGRETFFWFGIASFVFAALNTVTHTLITIGQK